MLPERFRAQIHKIASDRKAGAIELALDVVDAFKEITDSTPRAKKEDIGAVVKFLSAAQPSMAPIHNAAEMSARILLSDKNVAATLGALRTSIRESREQVAANSIRLFHTNTTLITLSRSSTVMAALRLAASKGDLARLYVMESRPGLEGRSTAEEVSELGVECILVADAMGPSLASQVDMALVGADTILKDGGVVNKVGTYPLSLACRSAKKPLNVLAESIKLDRRFECGNWPGSEERDEHELLPSPPRGLRALNKYFDLTPPAYVNCVVHEKGKSKRHWEYSMQKAMDGMITQSA